MVRGCDLAFPSLLDLGLVWAACERGLRVADWDAAQSLLARLVWISCDRFPLPQTEKTLCRLRTTSCGRLLRQALTFAFAQSASDERVPCQSPAYEQGKALETYEAPPLGNEGLVGIEVDSERAPALGFEGAAGQLDTEGRLPARVLAARRLGADNSLRAEEGVSSRCLVVREQEVLNRTLLPGE
jgi:hypothetical protein